MVFVVFENARDRPSRYGRVKPGASSRGTGPRATGRGPGCLVSIPLLLVNDAEEGFADKDSFEVITEKSHRPV